MQSEKLGGSMKKLLIIGIVIASLLITGCSKEGILKLLNYSQEEIWYRIDYGYMEYLPSYTQISYSWDLASSIFGEDDKSVTVDYGGGYWWWYDYTTTRKITPGSTSKIDIYTNAGEIIVWNESDDYTILEVYLSPSDDISWGSNDLMGTIEIGQWVSWYVTPGWWDLLVVDNCGEFIIFDIYIGLGDTYIYYFDGLKSGEDTAQMKLENAKKYTEQTKDRVQQKEKN